MSGSQLWLDLLQSGNLTNQDCKHIFEQKNLKSSFKYGDLEFQTYFLWEKCAWTIEIKYEIEEVNPTNSFMIKVISGDISDNIKSVFQSRDKSGNIRGIGIKGAQSIIIKYLILII